MPTRRYLRSARIVTQKHCSSLASTSRLSIVTWERNRESGLAPYKDRGFVTGATEPNLAPDADPLAPEDSKSNSKQLKLKLSVWLVIPYHAFCQIVTGYGTQSLGLELCLLAAYTYN